MNPWRWPAWAVVALIVVADVVVIAADPATFAPMLAWMLATFVAGMVVGVSAMAGLVRRLERERDEANFPRSFLTFGPELPGERSRVPGHAAADAEPPTAALTAPTPLDRAALDARLVDPALRDAVRATQSAFEAGQRARAVTRGRTGARFALGVDEARATLAARACDPRGSCDAGHACDVHAPLHDPTDERYR